MKSSFSLSPWSLADLFPSHDGMEMQSAMKALEQGASDFEAHREELSDSLSPEKFISIIRELESIRNLAQRIYGFASLWFASDTQNEQAQAFLGSAEQKMAELENKLLFFSLWWKSLDDRAAERLMAESGDYSYWLEEMRHFKPHTLSEAEEKIINIKDATGVRAFHNLYDAITNRYIFKLVVNGEQKELTRGEAMVYARHHDPDLRAAAYQEIYRVYSEDGPILGQIYQNLVRDWHNENTGLRKFANPIAARNLANDIPDSVVDILLEVCQGNVGIYQRFFQLKAGLLGMPRLRRYDIYAPVSKSEKTYDFNTAAEMVLDSFNQFDPRVAGLAKKIFDDTHLDSEVRKGKRGGAFCATITPELTPWVQVNYQGRADDIATLAHELGHGIHALLADHHSLFTQHSSLPLAETASTFGEMLLIDHLLDQEQDEHVRRDLLFKQVDDAYATAMRQAYFALFERLAHDMVQEGASVSDLSAAYLVNLKAQFGEAVEVSEEFSWEWVSIPHIYQVPFYVYAYTFGKLLVLSLYQQFKIEGESFKPRYLNILSAGGSEAPVKILSDAGVEVTNPKFWQGGFDVIDHWVRQLEALPAS